MKYHGAHRGSDPRFPLPCGSFALLLFGGAVVSGLLGVLLVKVVGAI